MLRALGWCIFERETLVGELGISSLPAFMSLRNMALCLATLSSPVQWCVLRKGVRAFALLGKVTPMGLTTFTRQDVEKSWGLTAESGALRLERFGGDEEVTGEQLFLPTPFSNDYGITGGSDTQEVARAVFGLLPQELEQLVTVLQRGSFPVLGFSQTELRCSISGCTIPGCWPHLICSNLALYGNVLSLETFIRALVCSLPQGQLSARFPTLQPIFKRMMKLTIIPRKGIPYCKEMLEMAPSPVLATAAKT